MKSIIHFLRTHKAIAFLLTLLILVSFIGLAAHLHEADHGTHDCPICRAAQILLTFFISFTVFLWAGILRNRYPVITSTPVLASAYHGAILCNRAPPLYS